MLHRSILSLFLLSTTATAAAIPKISYKTPPTPLWNQAISTTPSQNNAVTISPDNAWLYITSVDYGTLSKLNPTNGKFVRYYDQVGKDAVEGGRFGYGQGGIEFYMQNKDDSTTTTAANTANSGGGGSYLLYWVLDVSQQGYYSKVICIEHDADSKSEQIVVRWVATLSGVLNGMPKIGSDGKFIYLTINADTNTDVSVNTNNDSSTNDSTGTTTTGGGEGDGVSPSEEPPATTSSTNDEPVPTPYWFINVGDDDGTTTNIVCDYGTDFPQDFAVNGTNVNATLFETRDECCVAQPIACQEAPTGINSTATIGEPAEASSLGATTDAVPDGSPEGETTGNNRKLQAPQKSGRFIILNADNGNVVYSFDSRDDFTIRKHAFGPLGIARRPKYGNYAGGEDNTNDVVMWGSGKGIQNDNSVGETLLFQLPKGFDTTSLASSATLVNQFETRVMESVSWTTDIAPTFSKDGLSVYFLISGDRLTGWNKGQSFDIAPNVGPVDVSTANSIVGRIQRPMVLTNDDNTLLVGTQDTMYGVDVSTTPASILWQLDTFGSGAAFTTPQITPDGIMAYFGKSGALHAVNLTADGGALLWEDTNGYVDPFSSMSQITMADFSLDATGQIVYYCRGGSDTITALRIGEVVPTEAPTFKPSAAPSVTASMSPSTSMAPTLSMNPTYGSDYIFPSASPSATLSDVPSTSPSVKPTVSPTKSGVPTIVGGGGVAAQPDFTVDAAATPTASPNNNTTSGSATATGSNSNPTSLASTKEDGNTSSFPLSMPAIIGIAVGGGIGLILLLGSLCYMCRKKPCKGGGGEDDGVDTDWQSSNENQQMQFSGGGGSEQNPFQYGDEENDPYEDGPLKW